MKTIKELEQENKKLREIIANSNFITICKKCEYPISSNQSRIIVNKQLRNKSKWGSIRQIAVYHLKCYNGGRKMKLTQEEIDKLNEEFNNSQLFKAIKKVVEE